MRVVCSVAESLPNHCKVFCRCCAVSGLKGGFKRNCSSFSFLLPSYLSQTQAVLAERFIAFSYSYF